MSCAMETATRTFSMHYARKLFLFFHFIRLRDSGKLSADVVRDFWEHLNADVCEAIRDQSPNVVKTLYGDRDLMR